MEHYSKTRHIVIKNMFYFSFYSNKYNLNINNNISAIVPNFCLTLLRSMEADNMSAMALDKIRLLSEEY